jgi:CRP-like cAMP-binding protein
MVDDNTISFCEMAPILKNVTIFSGFDEENIRLICEKCEVLEFDSGTIIIEENTPANEIYILLKGCVSIVLGINDEPFELLRFGSGNCLGEASVIGIQRHSASAVTIEKSTVLVLSRALMIEIFNLDKALFSLLILNIARELARRLHNSNELFIKYRKGELKMNALDTDYIFKKTSIHTNQDM